MRIASVKIANFRCFQNLERDLETCHALVGENGSGKTAVLEAIALATSRSPVANRIDEQDFHLADQGELSIEVRFSEPFLLKIPDGYATQDVPCDRLILSAHRRDKAAPGTAFSGPVVAQHIAVPMAYEPDKTPSLPNGLKGNVPSCIKKTDEGFELYRKSGKKMELTNRQLSLQNDLAGLPNVFYFGRDREKESKVGFGTLLGKIAKDLNWRFRKNWKPDQVGGTWDAFYTTVLSGLDVPKSDRLMDPLRKKMKLFFGHDFSDLELSLLNIEQPFSKAYFARRTATNQIDQGNLGSGVSILLSFFLLDTVSRLSKEEFIFLIDEPELHLHPQLQRRLHQEFRDSDFQVVYTTQSDIFVDVAEWRSISRFAHTFTVTPTAAGLAAVFHERPVSEHLDEIKKWHHQKSLYFREDNQILFSRRCLLVEGPAEKYGLPVLAGKLKKDLGDITIVSCNGKSKIPYYQLLCRAFEIPFFTLFDLDGEAATSPKNEPIMKGCSDGTLSFPTSFEKILGISPNSPHKASETFAQIDVLSPDQIPAEIQQAVTAIFAWANRDGP